jgi:hypothetical protein
MGKQTFVWMKYFKDKELVVAVLEVKHDKKVMLLNIINEVVSAETIRATMADLNQNGNYDNEETFHIGDRSMQFMLGVRGDWNTGWREFVMIINKLLVIPAVEYVGPQR